MERVRAMLYYWELVSDLDADDFRSMESLLREVEKREQRTKSAADDMIRSLTDRNEKVTHAAEEALDKLSMLAFVFDENRIGGSPRVTGDAGRVIVFHQLLDEGFPNALKMLREALGKE